MSNHKLLLSVIALIMSSGLLWILCQGGSNGSIEAWNEADIELVEAEIDPEAEDLGGERAAELDRQVLSIDAPDASAKPAERLKLGISGRIVDGYSRPLADATVRLEVSDASQAFGGRFRRGRRERVRKPFITGKDGLFSFKLRVYQQTQVRIYASRAGFAPRIAEQSFAATAEEDIDTGDTVLTTGGSLIGRITDLAGAGIAAGEASLRPGNGNAINFAPDRNQLLQPTKSDAAGFFSFPHLMPGEYRITAEAKHQQRRQEPTAILIEEGQQVDVGNLALGPGFEIFGYVYNQLGEPLKGARIEVRNSSTAPGTGSSRSGRRNRGGHQTRINEHSLSRADGSFSIDHLPNAPISLLVSAPQHLSFRQDDIDPTLGQTITVQLLAGLSLTGLVLDDISGLAVTRYAVKLRRQGNLPRAIAATAGSNRSGRGSWRGNRGGRGASQRFNLWRNPNRIPNDLGEASEHLQGDFRFDGLDEGVYLVDIGASEEHYVLRSDPIELRRENSGASVELRLSRGYTISGKVLAKGTGAPLLGVRIELMRVRAQDPARGQGQQGRRGGRNRNGRQGNQGRPDFSRFAKILQGNTPSGERILEVSSDVTGEFRFPLQAPARYFLVATRKGLARNHSEPFVLEQDQDGIELELGHRASLSGQISGVPPAPRDEIHVIAFAGMRDQKSVLAKADGSYRFDDLEPGDYFVRAVLGDPQAFRREMISKLFTEGSLPPYDLNLREGQDAEMNLLLEVAKIGEVRGTVLVNGEPAKGYRINLASAGSEGASGRRSFRGGRNQSATSDGRGEFKLRNIPIGEYSLRVQAAGRGRGGDIHRQDIYVQQGLSTDVHIDLYIGSIQGTVTAADGSPAQDLRGRVLILPGQAEMPKNLRNFARNHSYTRATVSGGKFAATNLSIGPALLVLQIKGRKEASSLIQIQTGRKTEVTVEAGDKTTGN